jgi:2-(3-amino-3-carboxypropyl)histidine synthase
MISTPTLEKIESLKPKKLYLQVPEGLKTRVLEIAKFLEDRGIEVFVGADPCYGACDLRDKEAKALGCDLLVHIGHASFGLESQLPVIYEPYEIDFNPIPLLEKHIGKLGGYKKISPLTTIQFESCLSAAKEFLEKNGKEVIFAKNTKTQKEGIILGCDHTAVPKDADCYLFLGSGIFHPLGVALKTEKNVFSLDFETGELRDFAKEKEKFQRVKAFHIGHAKEADKFGILISTKPGQLFPEKAAEIKKVLSDLGKKTWILVMDDISPSKIEGMDLDILVNCACPRMGEDHTLFKKPILNPEDVLLLQ